MKLTGNEMTGRTVTARVLAAVCSISLVIQGPVTAMAQSAQNQAPDAPAPRTENAPSLNEPGGRVPFNLFLKTSHNPLDWYRGKSVPPVNLANSARLSSFIRDGKLYLTLRDAIDLALQDNLDMVIARYNLPIAQMDVLRTSAGGSVRGVNTGVVSGTPGGASSSVGGSGSGAGSGGTTSGAGGAGAGAGGLVQNTIGGGTSVSNYDPYFQFTTYVDHTSQLLPNKIVYGVPVIHLNTVQANFSYSEAFPTGGSIQATWNNNRETTNSPNNSFNPQFFSSAQIYAQQPLLAGFGFGPNLRYLRIAKTNKKVTDIAFKAQVIATVTQISNLYWNLVAAYDTAQVNQRSVDFANQTLEKSRKQVELQAIPEMDVLKAQGELATRKQELTVARTNLELQELYMKNAITRSLEDPILEEMAVVPLDHIAGNTDAPTESVQELIDEALKNRPEVQESTLQLKNSELSRKSERNALLPSLSVYGFLAGTGYSGPLNPLDGTGTGNTTPSNGLGGALTNAFNYSSPEYQVGIQLGIPIRNRIAKADQYRTELEFRQSQLYLEEQKKSVRIEVRNARFALEQQTSRVDAAREARDLASKTLDIYQKEQKLGAGSNQQTLSAEHDLAVAENALVTAQTDYAKARIELMRATGSILENYGISVEANHKGDATGNVTQATTPTGPGGQ
jgi:outer membrane protein TolC